MFTPTISHLTCELDQQRRLLQLAREARIRSVIRERPRWGGRWFGRSRRLTTDFAADLGPSSEDVWRAFRF